MHIPVNFFTVKFLTVKNVFLVKMEDSLRSTVSSSVEDKKIEDIISMEDLNEVEKSQKVTAMR